MHREPYVRNCALMPVGVIRNATSGYIKTCMQLCTNMVYFRRKEVRNHEGRTEIQNELFEKRRARTHGFRAEMVVRTVKVRIENTCR